VLYFNYTQILIAIVLEKLKNNFKAINTTGKLSVEIIFLS